MSTPKRPSSEDVSAEVDLRSLTLQQLEQLFEDLGQPSYRAKQVFRWVHQRGVRSVDEMTDHSKDLRAKLAAHTRLTSMEIGKVERASDGTRKYALRTATGDTVEAVFIPDASAAGRHTLCISSQVGCAVDCKFCLTASLGLLRNLSFGEIVEQITRVKEDLAAHPHDAPEQGAASDRPMAQAPRDNRAAEKADAKTAEPRIGNIVMMGMGEPLANYGQLIPALQTMSADLGHHISPRRITVSTSGLAHRIPKLGEDVPVNLAVSLNATTDAIRDRIMPINKRWNIEKLLDACRRFPLPPRRRITFEYVMLKDINDSDEDARRLIRLLRGFRCKVNLIPFNEHPYSPFKTPSAERVERFQRIIGQADFTVLVRTPRGDDISAACGMLEAKFGSAGSC
ncbi:MAG: 23S rRNA (adenine(2503)-C(2))-methyltransferase RlmN, partial [Myxococcota bacterium]